MTDKFRDRLQSDPGYLALRDKPLTLALLWTVIIAAAAYIQITGFRIWDLW